MPTMAEILQSAPGYFKVSDVPDPITLTVETVRIEEIGQSKEEKQVVVFQETPRKLILNQTRLAQLSEIASSGDIKGTKVALVSGVAHVNGRDFNMILVQDPEAVSD